MAWVFDRYSKSNFTPEQLRDCTGDTQNYRKHQPLCNSDSSSATQAQHQVKGALLLNVVIRKSSAILKLLAGEDQALLIGRDSFFILDLGLHVVDAVRGFHIKCDGFAREGLHKYLHSTTQAQHQVKGALLLNVVIRKSSAILKLLAGEDQALLIGRDSFFILDL